MFIAQPHDAQINLLDSSIGQDDLVSPREEVVDSSLALDREVSESDPLPRLREVVEGNWHENWLVDGLASSLRHPFPA